MLLIARPAVPRSGFTFVELMLVVMVLGIMAGIAAPRFQVAVDGVALETAAKGLATHLRHAREVAINQGRTLGFEFLPLADSYRSIGLDGVALSDPEHPGTLLSVVLSQTNSRVSIQSASFGGTEQVMFDFRGDPTSSGQVVFTTGTATATVQVNPTGEVTVTP